MKRRLWTLCAVLVAGACTQDSPTEAGSGLLPPNAIRTFEFVLEPERYLQWDTAFGLYSATANAPFAIIANEYEGVLSSRVLLRYQIPRTISVIDTAGVLRTDSMPIFFEGDIRILVDTVASTEPPADVSLYRTTEDWDRLTATWEMRVDSGAVQIPWTQPGGSPGALIGSAPFTGVDTLFVPVDSLTLAVWADTTDATRGGLLDVSAGTRLRTALPTLRIRARSTMQPDTVVELSVAPGRTFIFEPEQLESTSEARVGGTPEWRTLLRLRERLDTLRVPCPGQPDCTIPISELSINYAATQWQPVPSPTGFAPERPLEVALHALLPSPLVPLERSPVTGEIGFPADEIPVSSFTAPGGPIVEIPATAFMRLVFTPPDTAEFVPTHLALLPSGAIRTFGFGSFAGLPSMRIIVTISRELQLP